MAINRKNLALLASVFITGSAVLIIEIIAIRILSPHYGNTIYVTSSVIGIILLALSIGYWVGGMIADKYPHYHVFYAIIGLSGTAVMLMQFFSGILLAFLSTVLSITQGPLVSSLLLFFVPAFLLATLSPLAVKLYHTGENLGQQTGNIFFWSTLGSINGTILAGFFLIPSFGIDTIIIATGAALGLWGLAGFVWCKPANKKMTLLMVGALIFSLSLFYFLSAPKNSDILYQKDGVYEKITIQNGVWGLWPARFLLQDKSYSAAMYLNSDELVFDYTKYNSLYKLINPTATQALVIGGGAYSIPKALLQDSPNMQVDVAEIEPSLYEIAKTHFNLPDDNRLKNYVQDGRKLLATNDKIYDIIVGDAYYSLFSVPIHLTTKEFFILAKNRLATNGVFVGNFVGYLDENGPSFIASEIKTFKNVFENSYFFATRSPNSPFSQNIIFLGINGPNLIDFSGPTIIKNSNPILSGLKQKNINISHFDFSKHEELTDNYAPVEYLVSKIINRWQ